MQLQDKPDTRGVFIEAHEQLKSAPLCHIWEEHGRRFQEQSCFEETEVSRLLFSHVHPEFLSLDSILGLCSDKEAFRTAMGGDSQTCWFCSRLHQAVWRPVIDKVLG